MRFDQYLAMVFVRGQAVWKKSGWGGRNRTSEWRNQNLLDYLMISRRIWKNGRNML
jgi:hypothetical protein